MYTFQATENISLPLLGEENPAAELAGEGEAQDGGNCCLSFRTAVFVREDQLPRSERLIINAAGPKNIKRRVHLPLRFIRIYCNCFLQLCYPKPENGLLKKPTRHVSSVFKFSITSSVLMIVNLLTVRGSGKNLKKSNIFVRETPSLI